MSLRQPHVAAVLVTTLASTAALQGCAKAKIPAADAINASDNTPPFQAPAGDEAPKDFAARLGAWSRALKPA